MKQRWEKAKPYFDYLDLAVAATFGLLFTVLGLTNAIGGEALSQAAIALLALLAFSLLRDRIGRERVEKLVAKIEAALDRTVREIQQSVDESQNDSSYHTRSLELTYDLVSPDGRLAYAKKKREVRFTRNNVLSLTNGLGRTASSLEARRGNGGPLSTNPPRQLQRHSRVCELLR